MILHLTQAAIDKAWENAHVEDLEVTQDCLMATAAKMQFPEARVSCGYSSLKINDERFLLPQKAVQMVYDWMDYRGYGKKVEKPEPQDFELELLD